MMFNKCAAQWSRVAYNVGRSPVLSLSRPYSVAGENGLFTSSHHQLRGAAAPCLLQQGVVLYDGVCHLCNTGVKWVIRADRDKKIKFCAVQSRSAEPYLTFCGADRDAVLRRFLFVEGPGLCHQGSTDNFRCENLRTFFGLLPLLNFQSPNRMGIKRQLVKTNRGCIYNEDLSHGYGTEKILLSISSFPNARGLDDLKILGTLHEAALKVLSHLPLPYSALSVLLVLPTPLRDAVYDYIAKRRYQWFGKAEECIIPNEEVLDRFLDRDEIVERLRKSF